MMRALCNMLIHFEFFRQYFVSNRHIGVFFFSVSDTCCGRLHSGQDMWVSLMKIREEYGFPSLSSGYVG